jgi:hypothetical protein
MTMGTKSIYAEGTKDTVFAYAAELQTCENLLAMGYTHSFAQSLSEREKYLKSRIAEMERLSR